MNLSQILRSDCIKIPLVGKTKEDVIAELVEMLNAQKVLKDKNEVLDSVLMREKTRSTGIGSGIAIPHGKCKGVKQLYMAFGLAKEGIDFASIDGKPAKIIILLVSPLDQTGPHIQALAKISRLMLDTQFKKKLEKATTPEDVVQIIKEKEAD
jgi:fructose-specific phosphotransferase system IIA component